MIFKFITLVIMLVSNYYIIYTYFVVDDFYKCNSNLPVK